MKVEYEDGKPNGSTELYYPDGTLSGKGEMVDGLREGAWTFYHSWGSAIESKGMYKAGKLSGIWKFFNKRGRPIREVNFDEKG